MAEATQAQDGRVQRGERNRELILDALFTLVESGELQPTAEQVAQQAGVGTRTVFRHFADMESLYVELHERVEKEVRPLLGRRLPAGDITTRAAALIQQRSLIFERISPFMLSGQALRHGSRFLQQSHARFCRILRTDLEKSFVAELAAADEPAQLLDGLDLLASFEAWHRLRTEQGLSRTRASRVVHQSLLAIFVAAGTSGTSR